MFVKRCANCGKLNPRTSVVCQYCSVSLGRYRMCSRGHQNRWDAQFCGTCGDVFLSPPGPLRSLWEVSAELLFSAGMLALFGYFLWQQRVSILIILALFVVVLAIAQWLLRPFARLLPSWLGWFVLFRYLKRR
jgi:hypothetical protein